MAIHLSSYVYRESECYHPSHLSPKQEKNVLILAKKKKESQQQKLWYKKNPTGISSNCWLLDSSLSLIQRPQLLCLLLYLTLV